MPAAVVEVAAARFQTRRSVAAAFVRCTARSTAQQLVPAAAGRWTSCQL